MTESEEQQAKPTKVDEAASAACTRSGAFALLLSLALVLLIPYWIDQPHLTALAVYVAERVNLTAAFDSLDDDPAWRTYKATNANAESMSLTQLHGLQVLLPAIDAAAKPTAKTEPPRKMVPRSASETVGTSGHRAPAPPGSPTAHVGFEISEVSPIERALIRLNDSDTLTRSRQVSNFFSISIARWGSKRSALAFENVLADFGKKVPCALEVEVQRRDVRAGFLSSTMYAYRDPEFFVPSLTQEAMLNCLTVRDLRELAHYEQPTISNPLELGGRIGPTIELAPGSLPRGTINLTAATLAIQVLLFFVVMYFGAFAREAVSSSAFPAPGTLFGAFDKSRSTLALLFFALWIPFATSLLVTLISKNWLISVCTFVVGGAILSVQFVLARKSLFAKINPLLMLKKRVPS